MKQFVDLHLRPPIQDVKATEKMASLAAEMEFRLVGLTFATGVSREARLTTTRLFEDQGLETASRVDLYPKDRNQLLKSLKEVRPLFDIVAVECSAKQVSSIAFRDRRVDLVFFSLDRPKLKIGELAPRRSKRPVEFNVADLLKDGFVSESSLRRASSIIWSTGGKHLPIVASSGATGWLLMRGPKDMAAVLAVLGLDTARALDAVSGAPFSLAQENLEKRGPRFISDGIEIVRSQV